MQVCSRIISKVYVVTDGELKHNKQQQLEDGTSRLGWESWRTCVHNWVSPKNSRFRHAWYGHQHVNMFTSISHNWVTKIWGIKLTLSLKSSEWGNNRADSCIPSFVTSEKRESERELGSREYNKQNGEMVRFSPFMWRLDLNKYLLDRTLLYLHQAPLNS